MPARQWRISTGQTLSAESLRLVIEGRMPFRRPGPHRRNYVKRIKADKLTYEEKAASTCRPLVITATFS